MKYCTNCGVTYHDGLTYCPQCGRMLTPYSAFTYTRGPVYVVTPAGRNASSSAPAQKAPQGAAQGRPVYRVPAQAAPVRYAKRPVNGVPEHGEPAMLKLTDITKDYKIASGKVHALDGISLEFRRSEFVCILGQSGCGKTTLLNIIGGLDHYTTGDLVIAGRSTKKYRDRDWDIYRNHRIGFIFQTYNLIPHQTVLENVELALTIAGVSKAERKKRAKQALERVGLAGELKKRPNQLSGGQMQRVAIARAIVNDPDILLADEPTGALDSKTSVEVMELIKEIARERLVIMVTHNGELAEQYASRIVRLKDGKVEADSNPYIGDMPPKEQVKEKTKKSRAKMSFFTSLALSFRNLLTKKGRTIITSVAGSIGIISVCLVLALSNGFNNYIRHTEEDMLSYYPLEVSETALDVSSVMSAITSPSDLPDLEELGDRVYINSFLTGLAQGIAVQNDISEEYINYLEEGKKTYPEWFSALSYNHGLTVGDAIYTRVVTGGVDTAPEVTERDLSITGLKEFFIQELISYAQQYSGLLRFVDFFTDVINTMPGTTDFQSEEYGDYVLSQYDVIAGHFPQNEHEAVLVVGENNSIIDLTLVQLGFLTESQFLDLFLDAVEDETVPLALTLSEDGEAFEGDLGEDNKRLPFERIFAQPYTMYNADTIYTDNPDYPALTKGLTYDAATGTLTQKEYAFEYQSDMTDHLASEDDGISFKISGILRLKDNFTYGCLSSGLNLTEGMVNAYLARNLESKIAQYIKENSMTIEGEKDGDEYRIFYMIPSANLADDYAYSTPVKQTLLVVGEVTAMLNYSLSDKPLRSVGGETSPNDIKIYAADFDAKDEVISYLDAWNDTHDEGQQITYTDRVGLLMGMVQTMLDVITYVLVAFTAISLVVSSVMIGIITYVSVVERIKEIGVLRSLGARKKDIRSLFNAETFIIGLAAGLIGIAVTYLISGIISYIIFTLSGIAGIATLPPLTALIMVLVSVTLTLISGLIPAQAAANKDPVISLRTE